ncbi:MAG: glycosyltransferase [Sphingobacteriaceae bacterium]|nr:glycosyltransferase [Sphingobacteriaceae bacterium]
MKPKIENKICAVTVTYGNRWKYLEQVLRRLLSFRQTGNVVVVNNGSEYDVEEALKLLGDSRILLVNHAENEGSAGGYYSGIAAAYEQTTNEFIWLLDDDNLPDEDAAEELFKAWDSLKAQPLSTALYCQRVDRTLDREFIQGKDPFKNFLIPNGILGVSYLAGIERRWEKHFSRKRENPLPKDYIKVPYVPYGGVFAHREMIGLIGYPDRQFYLYVDDEEYTYRITQRGGTIWMVSTAKIKDIDLADGRVAYQPKKGNSPLLDLWSFRMYYRVRNSIYFHNKISTTNPIAFAANKSLFIAKLWWTSVKSGKGNEFRKVKEAIQDGIEGRLGKADSNKF